MNNQAIGLSLIVFALIGLLVAVSTYVRRKQITGTGWFICLCVSNTLWAVLDALVYLVPNESAVSVFQGTKLAFAGTSTLIIYILVQKILKDKSFDWVALVCLFSVPVITFVLGLTNASHGLLLETVGFIYQDGVRIVLVDNGLWFWLYCVFCYVLVILSVNLIIRQLVRLHGKYRSPALIFLAALILCVIASVGAILRVFPYALDPMPYAAIALQIMLYFALSTPASMEMLLSSREVIFEQSANIMFILNNEREIIDMNSQAKRIVDQLGIKVTKGLTYDDVYDQWTARNNARDFAEDASIFTIEEDNRNIHYQKLSSSIYNKQGVLTGTFIEIKNITPMMTLIHKLQDSAYFDYLTGLHNRNYLISILNDWSEKELLERDILPLGIVVGDVNGLKRINDVYGHSKGDLLLQLVAADISKYKPEGGITFRMGGDEFITLVPRSDKEELNYYVNVMENKDYSLVTPELVESGIAISYVLKKDSNISIMESIHEADVLMYTKKKNRRKA